MAPSRQYSNHPDPMDLWLETQGYYRKLTARDGSCLFRAISEQIYFTQMFHLDVRRECVEYLRDHLELFDGYNIEGCVESYLEHLQSPTQWGSPLEIVAMSHRYKIDIVILKEIGVPAEKVAETQYGKSIMLCFSHDRHYDSVYLKEFTKVAGYCQSLVYEILYKSVFGMKDVDYAVEKMLHYKPLRHRGEGTCGSRKFFSYSCNSIQLQRKGILVDALLDDGEVNVRDLLMKGVTPFPYKVAKSLDPDVFRNVEFDVWIDYRRGLRQGFFGCNNELRVGVKCLVKIDDTTHVAHIQEMAPDKGPVVVFVEDLGEKCTVLFESLELLPQDSVNLKQITITNHRNVPNPSNLKTGVSPDCSGSKVRKGRLDNDLKGKGNFVHGVQLGLPPMGRRRNNSKSDQSSVTDNSSENLSRTGGVYQDANIITSFPNFTVDGYAPNGGYHPYQILIPVSPRPEDVPAHWLPPNDVQGSTEMSLTSDAHINSSHTGEIIDAPNGTPDNDQLDANANYMPDMNLQEHQINFNAPKSVLDDGADLPMTDIQTLRFFYNLGNDVYHTQCSVYGWGGYSQPCAVTSPPTPNPTGMCVGKCVCGPVCISTVPTIHRLLEPTTPPTSSRRRRKDSLGGPSVASETEPPSTSSSSQQAAITSLASVPPRLRAKGKNKKDAKAYEGQPLVHQPTLQIPTADESSMSETQNNVAVSDHASPTLSVSFSPPYSYVYYPTSPVVPYSPVESDPFFAPLRLQFPTDYTPDTPQSPQCFSVSGDMSVYGSSPQYSMVATPPHYLVPASPGIYVGSPPAWSPMTPTTPQQQS